MNATERVAELGPEPPAERFAPRFYCQDAHGYDKPDSRHAVECVCHPIVRASVLGAEHGRVAAEAWLRRPEHNMTVRAFGASSVRIAGRGAKPVPDLSDDYDIFSLGLDAGRLPDGGCVSTPEMWAAYEAAFTAAVEATVRAQCEGAS